MDIAMHYTGMGPILMGVGVIVFSLIMWRYLRTLVPASRDVRFIGNVGVVCGLILGVCFIIGWLSLGDVVEMQKRMVEMCLLCMSVG
jgi:hypothetical protein